MFWLFLYLAFSVVVIFFVVYEITRTEDITIVEFLQLSIASIIPVVNVALFILAIWFIITERINWDFLNNVLFKHRN